jgi:hypothetical protein
MTEKTTKKPTPKKTAPKKEKQPSLDELKTHLKELTSQRQGLTHIFESELAKIEDKRNEERRLFSAARAEAIKPHEAVKQESYAKAKLVFEHAKAKANEVFDSIVNDARAKLNQAIKEADEIRKVAQDVAREEFEKHSNELFEEHKTEQEGITKKFDALAKALKNGIESSRKKITDEIEELEKTIEVLAKRDAGKKDGANPAKPSNSGNEKKTKQAQAGA